MPNTGIVYINFILTQLHFPGYKLSLVSTSLGSKLQVLLNRVKHFIALYVSFSPRLVSTSTAYACIEDICRFACTCRNLRGPHFLLALIFFASSCVFNSSVFFNHVASSIFRRISYRVFSRCDYNQKILSRTCRGFIC
jgi:hypothetical protein